MFWRWKARRMREFMKCKYSVGACTAGTVYGMCGNLELELVVTCRGS